MRTRYLKPGFFENEDLAALPATTRLLFAGLWLLADRKGRLRDRPARIKGELFPYDNTNVERGLKQLAEAGFIERYEVDGQRLIWLPSFLNHQKPYVHEPASTLARHPNDQESDIDTPMVDQSPTNGDHQVESSNSSSNSIGKLEGEEEPPAHPFAFLYAQKHRELKKTALPGATHGAALSLESQFGAAACIQIANEKGWDKHPNYLKEALEDPKRKEIAAIPARPPSRRFTG